MADMIKFYKGAVASLPTVGVNGAIYITNDEGGIYLGTGTGMKRLGDFIQVDAVANLPTDGAHTSALYYCVAENILAKWNGSEWIQINKQRTKEETIDLLGLGDLAYKSEIAEGDLNEALAKKINDASAANHGHDNKTVLDGITAEKVAAWDASEQNAKDHADTELAKKVDKEDGKSLIADTEITRLAGMSDGANKVEASETNGNIKIDGVETVVYTHPEKHAIDDVTGLQDALDGKQAAGDYATKTEAQAMADGKDEAIAAAKKAGDDAAAALDTYKGEMTTALAGKQDVIPENTYDAYGSAAQALADAKAYADANDADTKYGITYDSENKKIKLVEGGTEVEIDATDFIKDGMIETVAIGDDNDLVITFNTAAGKENIVLPLDQLVDIYTGVEGARIKVTVASDKSISADLVAGSISKNYLDDGVQASLAKADSAIQEHQDISHLATEADLTLAENRITALEAIDHDKILTDAKAYTDELANGQVKTNKEAIENITKDGGLIATAKSEAITEAGKLDEALHTTISKEIDDDVKAAIDTEVERADGAYDAKGAAADAQAAAEATAAGALATARTEITAEIDADVKALADGQVKTNTEAIATLDDNTYKKTETYTQAEVDALIEAAHTWGEF